MLQLAIVIAGLLPAAPPADQAAAARRAKVALALAQAEAPPPAFVDGDKAAAAAKATGAVVVICVGSGPTPPADLPPGVIPVRAAEYRADGHPDPARPRTVVVARDPAGPGLVIQPPGKTLAETCTAAKKAAAGKPPAKPARLDWAL